MASMVAGYGLRYRLRNAASRAAGAILIALCLAGSIAGSAARAAPVRIMVLGDSLTAGYGLPPEQGFQPQLAEALKAQGHDVEFVNAAVSGDTTAGGRARLDWALGDQPPDAAIVELGANDALRGLDPRQMEANLTAILDTLAARRIPVLLSGMCAPPNYGPEYADSYRAVFDRLSRRPGVIYDPFFLADVASVRGLNQPDGLHPNAEGVKKIVARMLPAVDKLVGEASHE